MNPRKKQNRLKPLSLAGLTPEEALKAFMEVKPEEKKQEKKKEKKD